MDDRTWYLAVATLSAGVLITLIDTATSYTTPPAFYTFLGAVLGLLGALMAFRNRGGDDDG